MKNKLLIAVIFGLGVTSFFHLKYNLDEQTLSLITVISTLFLYLMLKGLSGFLKFNQKSTFKIKHSTLDFNTLISSPPTSVDINSIPDQELLDDRIAANDCLVINTIGVNKKTLDFLPNEQPPNTSELHCWIWVIRPDLSKELLKQDISLEVRELIQAYVDDKMPEFWENL